MNAEKWQRRSREELEKLAWDKAGHRSVETRGRLDFMMEAHDRLKEGELVVDAAAGKSWYYPFFEHTRYFALDYPKYNRFLKDTTARINIEADVINMPVKAACADAVLSVSMLEHMSEPQRFLHEAFRILRPGGKICIFVPFSTPVHAAPYDFFRYTNFGLEHILKRAGFENIDIRPSCGAFGTVLGNTKRLFPYVQDKGWFIRKLASFCVWRVLIPLSNRIDHWDTKRVFPQFYHAFASKPE